MTFQFLTPANLIVAGPSGAGKTVFVGKLLENVEQMFNPPPEQVIFAYGEYQPGYDNLKCPIPIQFVEGVPDFEMLKQDKSKPKLLIFDDLMQNLSKSKDMTKLFTRGSHHWNCTVIHIVQSLFFEGMKPLRRNVTYIVLFKSPPDLLQVRMYGKQIMPDYYRAFCESFDDAVKLPYGYLVVNFHPTITEEKYKLCTNIFPGENIAFYVPK